MTKILAVSDQVVERLYLLAANGHFQDVDLILGCGDLPYTYLEYFVSILNVPLYYVPGNHDPAYDIHNSLSFAEGGSTLDLKTVSVKGMLIAGLGGFLHSRRASVLAIAPVLLVTLHVARGIGYLLPLPSRQQENAR